jgi:four helix bundle protein
MPTIKRFEDIQAWQTARELTNLVYEISSKGEFAKDFGLRDQIRRAASSVMSNIAEGFDAGFDSEFVRFLGYTRRSASETQSQLYTALDRNYISRDQFQNIYEKATSAKRLINALIAYLQKSKNYSTKDAASSYEFNTTAPDPLDHPDQ